MRSLHTAEARAPLRLPPRTLEVWARGVPTHRLRHGARGVIRDCPHPPSFALTLRLGTASRLSNTSGVRWLILATRRVPALWPPILISTPQFRSLSFPLSSSPVTIELTQVSSTCCLLTRLRKSGGTRSLRCGCRRHRRHRFPVATICSASRKNRWSSRSLSPAPPVLRLPSPSHQRLQRHLRLRQRQRHGRLPLLPLLNE